MKNVAQHRLCKNEQTENIGGLFEEAFAVPLFA
jgi:hypothetical protein